MKRILSILLLLASSAAVSGPSDFIFMQRNTLDTGNVQRVIASPLTTGFFTYNATTKLGGYSTLGTGLTLSGGVLSATVTPGPAGADGAPGAQGAKGDKGDPGTTDWAGITSRPTTLAGFGITDAYPLAANPAGYLTNISNAQVTTALGITPVSQAGARASISLTTTGNGAATYNSTTGTLNVPTPASVTVPVINRTRITTAADGNYAWTLPVSCASGAVPIVSITPESSTAGDPISHRVVGTPTNTTINVFAGRSPGLTVLGLTVLGIPAGAAIPLHLIAICP